MSDKELLNHPDEIDVCKKLFTFFIKYDKHQVTWIETKDDDDGQRDWNSVELIIDAINGDYHKDFKNTRNLAANYLESKLSSKDYADIYCYILGHIHPYFMVDNNNCSLQTENLAPGVILSCYEIVYKISYLTLRGVYSKIYGDVSPEETISNYIKPIISERLKDTKQAETIVDCFINEYKLAVNDNNRRYDIYVFEMTLDTFKKILSIYINSDPHEIKKRKDNFLKLFILQLYPDIKNRILVMDRSIADIKNEYILGANLDLDETLSIDDYEAELDLDDYYHFEFYTFDQLLYMYLIQILDNETKIKRCESCKKLFIADSNKQKYCNYKIDGLDRSCRDVAAQEKFNNKCMTEPMLDLKRKIQKRFYKQTESSVDHIKKALIKVIKKKYYHYMDMIIGDYNNEKITREDGLKKLEASYDEMLNLINIKIKSEPINTENERAEEKRKLELENDVRLIMEKYIGLTTTK